MLVSKSFLKLCWSNELIFWNGVSRLSTLELLTACMPPPSANEDNGAIINSCSAYINIRAQAATYGK